MSIRELNGHSRREKLTFSLKNKSLRALERNHKNHKF